MREVKFRAWDEDKKRWLKRAAIMLDGTFLQPGTWLYSKKILRKSNTLASRIRDL